MNAARDAAEAAERASQAMERVIDGLAAVPESPVAPGHGLAGSGEARGEHGARHAARVGAGAVAQYGAAAAATQGTYRNGGGVSRVSRLRGTMTPGASRARPQFPRDRAPMAGRTSQGVRVESSARIPRGLGSAARWGGIGSGLGQGAFDGLGPNDYTTEQRLGRAAISGGSAAAGAATGRQLALLVGLAHPSAQL